MTVTRYNWAAEEMVEAAEGTYVTYAAYSPVAADLTTAKANLTAAESVLNSYLTTRPEALNGACVALKAYITAALAALND